MYFVGVDLAWGQRKPTGLAALDDAGRVLNPLILEGQIHGGIAQGAAQALLEEFSYDEDGKPVTGNIADYAFPSAAELPSYEIIHMETPTPINPLGAKGIGEAPVIAAAPAIANALAAAVGVRLRELPMSAPRIWAALQEARA